VQFGFNTAAKRRAKRIGGRRRQAFVARAHFAAAAGHATGKRRDHALDARHRLDRPPRSGQTGLPGHRLQDDVPAADPFGDSQILLDKEFAIHDRNPPETSSVHQLALLIAVAEEAEVLSQGDAFLGGRQAVENGRRGACHQALPRPIRNRFGQRILGKPKDQNRGPRPSVRRLADRQSAFDPRLGVARDHGRTVSRGLPHGRLQPVLVMSRHHQPRVAHAERFGERIVDESGSQFHAASPLRRPSLPAHHHVRFDDSPSLFQIRSRLVHEQPDGMDLVPRRLGQAIAGNTAGIRVRA